MAELQIEILDDGDRRVVRMVGDLDVAGSDHLKRVLHDERTATSGGRVVLDVGGLQFMDSSGLATLLEAHLPERSLVLVDPRPSVVRVLEVAQVMDLFPIERTDAAR